MAASKDDIRRWLRNGEQQGATHVIVVCDTFEWEDYPVYVSSGEKVQDVIDKNANAPMQKIMEVYNLSLNIERQLNEFRAYHV